MSDHLYEPLPQIQFAKLTTWELPCARQTVLPRFPVMRVLGHHETVAQKQGAIVCLTFVKVKDLAAKVETGVVTNSVLASYCSLLGMTRDYNQHIPPFIYQLVMKNYGLNQNL